MLDGGVTSIGTSSVLLSPMGLVLMLMSGRSIYIALGSSVLALALSLFATWRDWNRARGAIVLS